MARIFSKAGYTVTTADTLHVTLSAFSSASTKNFRIPSPTNDPEGFKRSLIEIIRQQHIDLIVPTCEEIFHISAIKESLGVPVFCDDISTLDTMHNKWIFNGLAAAAGLPGPKSYLARNARELHEAINELPGVKVIKPTFSRFGTYISQIHNEHEAQGIMITPDNPMIVQEYVNGSNFSSFSIFRSGRLLAHAAYSSKYVLGLGTQIYFHPVDHPAALEFATRLGEQLHLTGQFGFDFIHKSDGTLVPLECNPRTTIGGIALLASDAEELAACIEGREGRLITPSRSTIPMIGSGMISYLFKRVRSAHDFSRWINDYRRGESVIFSRNDMLPGIVSPIALGLLPIEAKWSGFSTGEMFSVGIRYNGMRSGSDESPTATPL